MISACSAPRRHSRLPGRGGVAAHAYSENTRRGFVAASGGGNAMSAKRSISNSKLRIEDIEAIKILKARYGYYCDDSYNPDGISSLFVEDGVWDGGQFGRH